MICAWFLIMSWLVVQIHCMNPQNKCNNLYYDEMDKILVNTRNQRTKNVVENFYKRRAKQSGMSFAFVKSCYENKKAKKPK